VIKNGKISQNLNLKIEICVDHLHVRQCAGTQSINKLNLNSNLMSGVKVMIKVKDPVPTIWSSCPLPSFKGQDCAETCNQLKVSRFLISYCHITNHLDMTIRVLLVFKKT